jgi:RNA polymerase sigma-70 factor (ECF subfamily)
MHARQDPHAEDPPGRRAQIDQMAQQVNPDFVAFFNKEFMATVSFLVLLGFDHDTAADATQEAMIDGLRSWPSINKPSPWIRTAALRRARRRAVFSRKELPRLVEKGYGLRILDGTEAYRELEGQEELLLAINCLGERQRQVLVFHLDGFSPDEIAQELSMRPTTVRTTLHQARKRLRSLLAGDKKVPQ